jgi:Zn-dependent protease with chaperone function
MRVQACYNLHAGIEVFEKMRQHSQTLEKPLWLQHWSSHPSFDDRIGRLRAAALQVLDEVPCHWREDLQASLKAV